MDTTRSQTPQCQTCDQSHSTVLILCHHRLLRCRIIGQANLSVQLCAALDARSLPLALLTLGAVGQSLNHTVVGRVLGKVLKPQESGALSREHVGHPAEGVVQIPDGDADAGLDLDASTDGLDEVSRGSSIRQPRQPDKRKGKKKKHSHSCTPASAAPGWSRWQGAADAHQAP